MDFFDVSIARLLSHEGGYSDVRSDPGNWTGGRVGAGVLKGTKFGIAANTYPTLDIKNLTWEKAKAIYRRDFWEAAKCHLLPNVVSYQLLDGAVNSGIPRATAWLQRAARVADDGLLGPVSLKAIKTADPNDLVLRFLGFRLEFMASLSTWASFGKGWARRIANNLITAAEDN